MMEPGDGEPTSGTGDVVAFASAFDVDPRSIRADTPLSVVDWRGSATDWLMVADHLGVSFSGDGRALDDVETVGDVIAIVRAASRPRSGGTADDAT
ncbi:MAG: hypothetical protein VXW92_03885 [Actinomycetota bacterium]|nr:hypothetical protein [Actinomycetota bacterium]MEC7362941.1 hypothetical protein [Actinomycetota bacterium]MEC9212981.1 hypothetical protein [Actinomycetota bacterium]